MQEIVVIDGEISLENTLDGEVELEAITDLDPDVVMSAGGGITPSGTIEITENGVYDVTEYASADVDVQGGITPTGTKQISITQNGTTTEDVTNYANAEINANVPASAVDTGTKSINSNGTHDVVGYANASVNVPNSYSASDEGKVVSNGALVAQTSDSVTQNGTVDTTLINSLTVNVSGGGSLGGLANLVDISDPELEIPYMLSAIKNGNTVGGTFTITTNFPNNSETLLISTGLSVVHGFMLVATGLHITDTVGTGQSNKHAVFFGRDFTNYPNNALTSLGYSMQGGDPHGSYTQYFGTRSDAFCVQGILRIDNGDIYYTGRYNKNASYQIILPNYQYEWLAW